MIGCTAFVVLREWTPGFPYPAAVGATLIFVIRVLAISFHLEMPAWLVVADDK